jgi:Abortive infection C-terminus
MVEPLQIVSSGAVVTGIELAAIEGVFDARNGYVLNFGDADFAGFFGDLGIDIENEVPKLSKGKRLRAYLQKADGQRVAQVVDALLKRRGSRDGDETSADFLKVKNLLARLQNTAVAFAPVVSAVDVVTLGYVRELASKTKARMDSGDLEGAITTARSMLEAVLVELETRLSGAAGNHGGNLPKQYKVVAKLLRIEDPLDDSFQELARGLVQIVNGLAAVRNKMSDAHAREKRPAAHHAHVVVNAANTVATFLVESYLIRQR